MKTKRRPRRAHTPTILQMEAVECGAAALAMVLAHFGRVVPLDELRVACGVSRDGSKANNLLRAARSYGLEAKGWKKQPEDLRAMDGPMILHWNFNHFVVLEGFAGGGGGKSAHLNDPASGPRTITESELDESFTGVVLTFAPTAAFRKGGERFSVWRSLRARLRGAATLWAVAFVVLAGLALAAPGLVAPNFNRIFIDDVLVRNLGGWLRPLLLAMGITAALAFALTAFQQGYLLRLQGRLALSTASRFFWHVLRLPVQFFTQRFAGDIGARVAINDRISIVLSGELATTAVSVLLMGVYALLLFKYDLVLASVGLATASLNVAALRWASRRRTTLAQKLVQDRGKMLGASMGALQTIDSIKASGAESDFFARWSGHQAKVVSAEQRLQLTTLVLAAVPAFLMAVNSTLVLGLGGLRVMDGRLTIGMLLAFQALLGSFLAPVNQLVNLGGTVQELKGDLNRLDDVLRARIDPALNDDGRAAPPTAAVARRAPGGAKLSGQIDIVGLTFGFSPLDPPLIAGFDLSLRPGSRVALVGSSGSGKSTIARLVAGLYPPWSGEILFDGLPRAAVPREKLLRSLGVVDQDICLFEDSVKENLTLWDGTVPEADLVQAARDACVHEELVGRVGGYESLVEEGGRNFSGGQRQRLEIARALAGNPTVLVLDEATSALDPATEKKIDDNLRRRGCTCLIVAHRLSTIRDCDEIIVLEKGKIVQRGPHDQLIGAIGPYRALISAEEA
jgi:NHLM bacteriocin system ABC transporter peptidase/ATP-binding protein